MDFSFDGGKYDREHLPDIRPVDIMDVLKQHRIRYVIHTSKGTIVLKHMTKRMKDHLDTIKYIKFPKARELEDESAVCLPLALAEGADEAVVARATALAMELAPIMDIYALGCIEYPFLTDNDDLEVFMQSLEPEEREAIRQMLTVLTRWNDPVDYSKLEIAERFHLQIIEREHVEEPTYQQFLALKNIIDQEHQQTEKVYRDMGVLK